MGSLDDSLQPAGARPEQPGARLVLSAVQLPGHRLGLELAMVRKLARTLPGYHACFAIEAGGVTARIRQRHVLGPLSHRRFLAGQSWATPELPLHARRYFWASID